MPKKPEDQETKKFQIRIPADLDRRLDILKAVNGYKSKNAQVLALIEEATRNIKVTFK